MSDSSDRLMAAMIASMQSTLITLGRVEGKLESLGDELVGRITRLEGRVQDGEISRANSDRPAPPATEKTSWAQVALAVLKFVTLGQILTMLVAIILASLGILSVAEIKQVILNRLGQ